MDMWGAGNLASSPMIGFKIAVGVFCILASKNNERDPDASYSVDLATDLFLEGPKCTHSHPQALEKFTLIALARTRAKTAAEDFT